MLTTLTHITLLVNDQDTAFDFYVNKLGFILNTDAMFGPQMRWLTISPSGQKNMELVLMKAENEQEKNLVGKQGATKPFLSFSTDDCEKTHKMLKAQGVKILNEPEQQPWGISMTIEDLYGNALYIVQS